MNKSLAKRLPRARLIEDGWDPPSDLGKLLDALTHDLLTTTTGDIEGTCESRDAARAAAVEMRRLIDAADADIPVFPVPDVPRPGSRAATARRQ